jgi:hypothetical protein
MSPALSEATFNVGQDPALALYLGGFLVWEPPGDLQLPNIGEAFEGGYYSGLISRTNDGVATHALVVSPRASGSYTSSPTIKWKTTQTASAGADSVHDGSSNTTNTNNADHPASQWCSNLSIGGFSDWYLPAIVELAIAFWHFKPTTDANIAGFDNRNYWSPARSQAFTTSEPAQSSVTAFRVGGSEEFLASNYWSSTEASATNALHLSFMFGSQGSTAKTTTSPRYIRAMRQVVL